MYENYFLNDKNHRQIMGVLYNYFQKKYDYEVGTGEEDLAMQMMTYQMRENLPANGEKPRDYILKMNKKCLTELIVIISQRISVETPDNKHLRVQEELKPINTLESNNDVSVKFEELTKAREPTTLAPSDVPIFGLSTETDNSAISSNFEQLAFVRETEQKKVEQQLRTDVEPINPDDNILGATIKIPIGVGETLKEVNSVENLNSAPLSTGQKLLIEKPKEFKNLENNAYKYNNNYVKTFNLVIDSRDRNTSAYPDNFKYQIDLDTIYKDVLSVELVSANVPKSEYLINTSNNKIYFTDNGSAELTATLPVGNYTPATLATAISTAMTTVATNTFTATVDSVLTNKFTIAVNTGIFTMDFKGDDEKYGNTVRSKYRDNSIGPVIGFSQIDVSGAGTYIGQNQYNLNGPTYVLLHIDDFDNLFGVHNNSITKSFAKIILDTEQNSYKFFKSQTDYITRKEYSPPRGKLAQLNISFLNYDGSFYDFGGLEHSIYFRIKTLNQSQGFYF